MATQKPQPKKPMPRDRKQQQKPAPQAAVAVADGPVNDAAIPEIVDNETQAFQMMERADEFQVMEAMAGRFSKKFIYDIPFRDKHGYSKCDMGPERCKLNRENVPHKHVRGLSWVGVKEGIRLWGHVHIFVDEPRHVIAREVEYYVCKARVVDVMRDVIYDGISKRVPLLRKSKQSDGNYAYEEDPFVYEKVQSFAMRNAAAALLPQPLVRAWFEDFVKGKAELDIKHVMAVARETDTVDRKAPTRQGTAPAPAPAATQAEAHAAPPQAQSQAQAPAKPPAPPAQRLPAPQPKPAAPAKPAPQAKPAPAAQPQTAEEAAMRAADEGGPPGGGGDSDLF
jgi:hypothetical protein